MKKEQPYIGGHVSVAGGLWNAFENAAKIGAECIQIFGANPRGYGAPMPLPATIEKYKAARKAHPQVQKVYLHAGYLVNLASPNPEAVVKSIENLSAHLRIAELLEADGLIFHIGSGKESPKEVALAQVVVAMKQVLEKAPGKAHLLIENAAGGGAKIGARPEEIGEIMKGVGSPRVKVCIDTAHSFEAGLVEGYTKPNLKAFLKLWDDSVGLENVHALHVNDSKTEFNSHHDRHENIGEGFIGIDGFKNLAAAPELRDKAWLLEVPGFDDNGPDKKNVEILRGLF